MTRTSQSPESEPVFRQVFRRLGTVEILLLLESEGELRFSEVAKALESISRQTLVSRLIELREAGMLQREVEVGPPVATRYSLTAPGHHLAEAASVLEAVSHRRDLPTVAA